MHRYVYAQDMHNMSSCIVSGTANSFNDLCLESNSPGMPLADYVPLIYLLLYVVSYILGNDIIYTQFILIVPKQIY